MTQISSIPLFVPKQTLVYHQKFYAIQMRDMGTVSVLNSFAGDSPHGIDEEEVFKTGIIPTIIAHRDRNIFDEYPTDKLYVLSGEILECLQPVIS